MFYHILSLQTKSIEVKCWNEQVRREDSLRYLLFVYVNTCNTRTKNSNMDNMEKVIIVDTAPILSPESEYGTCEDSTDTSNTSHIADTEEDVETAVTEEATETAVTEEATEIVDTEEEAVTEILNDVLIMAAIAETADNAAPGAGINTVDTTIYTGETVDTVQIINSDETIHSTEISVHVAKSTAENDGCVNADNPTTEILVAAENEASQSTEPEVADENDNTSENGSGFERDSGSSLDNYSEPGRDSPEQDTNDDEGVGDKDHDVECHVSLVERRQGGDGMERMESPQPQRKVDDDEDKNNPQYIPKRGTFYEHDYRTTEDVLDDEKADAEKEKADGSAETKKKVWHDKRENWSHDKFKDEDQTPKSRDELISIYGYDIRNEDGPPRARRRRRYGRGPNKYTRNWEDEDAYYKNSAKKPPQQRSGDQQQQESAPPQILDHSVAYKSVGDNPQAQDNGQRHESAPPRGGQGRMSAGTGRIIRPNRDYSAADYKSFTKARNFNRGSAVEQHQQRSHDSVGSGGGHRQQHQTPTGTKFHNRENRNDVNIVNQLDVAMGSISLQQQHNSDSNQHRPDRKPASKRYSSIRQRTLPESTMTSVSVLPHNTEPRECAIGNVMPLPQQQHFYGGNEYNTQQSQQVPQPPALQPPQTAMNVGMRPPPQLTIPPTTAMLRQQQFPPPPQFTIGPHAPPPQFLPPPPQPPTLNINYQLPPQHYYQHQPPPPPPPFVAQHQVQVVPAMAQPAEQLFQPQGGITYYSPEEQQTTQRHAPPMRPKAAIPILPPPPTPAPIANNSTTSASDSTS